MTTTIPAALHAAATRFSDHTALVDGAVRLSYVDLLARVRECARAFLASGVERGDRVAICSPNTYHWVLAALGALSAGATLVPINTRYTGHEMLDIVTRTRAAALVVAGPFLGADRLELLREAAGGALPPSLRTVVRVPVAQPLPADATALAFDDFTARAAAVSDAELDARIAALSATDPSDILFTSGTTGRSKGAMSSHAMALGVAKAWAELGGLADTDRYLIVNPFFHSFGYKAGILAAVQAGAAILPLITFDVNAAFELIEAERVSVLPGAPTIYQMMLDHPKRADYDLSSLRLAVTGAAVVPVVLVERMRTELKFDIVLTAYGLSEAVVATMCRPDDDPVTIATTCGRAVPGCEVRIADTAGAPLPAGQAGEVLLRGDVVMLGYLDDPDATAAAIDPDGWLHTGDVGVLDNRGYLTITDRIKDMYVSGGFNVYPAEVEQALARLDGVSDSAVIGIPDHRLGEVGLAYVVCAPGRGLTAAGVIAHCKTLLANYKVPREVEFLDELPRNAGGKVVKPVLRDRYAARAGKDA